MALVLNPLQSADARGSVGGITFSNSKGGSTVRSRTIPTNPQTTAQTNARAYLTTLTQGWAGLTDAQRLAWNNYAAAHPDTNVFGNQVFRTGHNWYVACNTRLLALGIASVATPPATAAPASPASLSADVAGTTMTLTWTATAGTDKRVEVVNLGPVSTGCTPKVQDGAITTRANGEAGTVAIADLSTGHYHVWARTVDEDNGLASQWVEDSYDVA